MPNWCSNWLEVTGPKDEVERFKNDAKAEVLNPAVPAHGDWPEQKAWTYKSDLSLAKLVPYPKEGDDDSDWYKKRLTFWGTKWDVEAYIADHITDKLCYSFESAWAPPMYAFETISKNYPTLEFSLEYDEPGCCFFGTATFNNGDVCDNEGEYTEGKCSECGEEQSVGPQGPDTECSECGSPVVSIEEYVRLQAEKTREKPIDADTIACDKYHAQKDDALTGG